MESKSNTLDRQGAAQRLLRAVEALEVHMRSHAASPTLPGMPDDAQRIHIENNRLREKQAQVRKRLDNLIETLSRSA